MADLRQEALARALSGAGGSAESALSGARVYSIAKRVLWEHLRERGRLAREEPLDSEQRPEAVDRDPSPDEAAERREALGLIRAAQDALREHWRALLEARYGEELPLAELAAGEDLGVEALKSRLRRARDAVLLELVRERARRHSGGGLR